MAIGIPHCPCHRTFQPPLHIGLVSILSIALEYFQSTDKMHDFLQRRLVNIGDISGHETFICLRVKKGRYVGV